MLFCRAGLWHHLFSLFGFAPASVRVGFQGQSKTCAPRTFLRSVARSPNKLQRMVKEKRSNFDDSDSEDCACMHLCICVCVSLLVSCLMCVLFLLCLCFCVCFNSLTSFVMCLFVIKCIYVFLSRLRPPACWQSLAVHSCRRSLDWGFGHSS